MRYFGKGYWESLFELSSRIDRLAGDLCLAQPATGHALLKVVAALHCVRSVADVPQVTSAFYLVMPRLGDGARRTALDAYSTFLVRIMQAVGIRPGGCPGAGGNFEVGYHAPAAVGDAAFGDEAVGKAESAQPGGVGDVPFRPVGEMAAVVRLDLEIGGLHRGRSQVPFFGEKLDHVVPQGVVEYFPEPALV